ncbi:MAG: hypothetical protein M1829_005991 [Trizodia sp. TS-e1964]|nr:MAG: hypothetical protein M1829_005991 [Trizodia sp. TS-e1964]
MNFPGIKAAPTSFFYILAPLSDQPASPSLWLYLGTAVALVLLGGAFAGLTIALMGQDEIYLQVIATSGEGAERKNAGRVLRLLKRGKHWVLVTLLLSNVITNETLPIVLDRSLGGGWPAVLSSTALIVIFGEIIPQSICVRYGLPIGAWMAPVVLALMYILGPIAWPTAKLLDRLLGEDHGTVYKKAGLKTLVTLHKTLGTSPSDRLNEDEVTIISAVLDLKDKSVGSIMTPMEDVFTMSGDTILDEETMDQILSAGYSRIPIHAPDDPLNFVGMLLVKILITYDPEDAKRVSEFALATLPETRPETSCLDIVNFFQEGKSHMVLVSNYPGENIGALGVVTLEDVIEELIGEEIIDESDVFIDVHKAIRRMAPAPKARLPKNNQVPDTTSHPNTTIVPEVIANNPESELIAELPAGEVESRSGLPSTDLGSNSQKRFLFRTSSNGTHPITIRANTPEMLEHLKHLGPSNLASKPKQTRYGAVKIKRSGLNPGDPSKSQDLIIVEGLADYGSLPSMHGDSSVLAIAAAGNDSPKGAKAPPRTYGTLNQGQNSPDLRHKNVEGAGVYVAYENSPLLGSQSVTNEASRPGSGHSKTGSPQDSPNSSSTHGQGVARSGNLSENIFDAGGVRKVVLETASISMNEPGQQTTSLTATSEGAVPPSPNKESSTSSGDADGAAGKKRRRRRRRKATDQTNSEERPLLENNQNLS